MVPDHVEHVAIPASKTFPSSIEVTLQAIGIHNFLRLSLTVAYNTTKFNNGLVYIRKSGHQSLGAIIIKIHHRYFSGGIRVPWVLQEHSFGCDDPVRAARLEPGEKVLNLGCGVGFDLMTAAKAVGTSGHAYGLDTDVSMLKKARININKLRIANATLLYCDNDTVPLFDESVDVIMSHGAADILAQGGRILRETHRVLVSGGRLVLSACMSGTLRVEEYREKLINAGFTDIAITLTKQHPLDTDTIKQHENLHGNGFSAEESLSANALIQAYKPLKNTAV